MSWAIVCNILLLLLFTVLTMMSYLESWPPGMWIGFPSLVFILLMGMFL